MYNFTAATRILNTIAKKLHPKLELKFLPYAHDARILLGYADDEEVPICIGIDEVVHSSKRELESLMTRRIKMAGVLK